MMTAVAAPQQTLGVKRLLFLVTLAVAAGFVGIAWVTEFRPLLYYTLLGIGVLLLLPVLLLAATMLLALGLMLLSAIAGGGDAGDVGAPGELVVNLFGPYYRWLGRTRHPLLLGGLLGVLLGCLLLWGLQGLDVLPYARW